MGKVQGGGSVPSGSVERGVGVGGLAFAGGVETRRDD